MKKIIIAACIALASCSPAQIAKAKADSKAALDKACEVRAIELATEAQDAGAR